MVSAFRRTCLHLSWLLPALSGSVFSASAIACSTSDMQFSEENQRLTIRGDVVCTLTDIAAGSPSANVLSLTDSEAKIWQLNAHLYLREGARLNLHGEALEGDVNLLRMKSEASGFVTIISEWGQVDIRNTVVTSWDTTSQFPDDNLEDGRAYITVRSFMGEDGTPKESRLDVIDSEIGYLGYYSGESYGLTWKLKDDRFDEVNVYGDLRNSYIHHNHRGHYSWGAFGSVIDNNEIAYSVDYGVDPHDDSDELVITNNYIHHSGNHAIICSKRCDNLVISGNTLEHNENGIMLHVDMVDSIVEDNLISFSRNTGIAVYDSHNNIIRNNTLTDNHIGLRALIGSYGNRFENNIVKDSERYGLFVLKGSVPSYTTDGRPRNNVFTGNQFINNPEGIFILEADNNTFTGNSIEGFSEVTLKSANDNDISNNTFTETPVIKGRGEEGAESANVIDDMAGMQLDLDAYSAVTIAGDHDQLKGFEDKNGLKNTFSADGQTLSLDEGKTFLSGPLVDLMFWVDAPATVIISDADLDKDSVKSWVATSPERDLQASFEVGDLLSARDFTFSVDGADAGQVTSNAAGKVVITRKLSEGTATEFMLKVIPEPKEPSTGGGASFWLLLLLVGAGLARRLRIA